MQLPPSIGSIAELVDGHLTFIFWVIGIWFVLAEAALFYALLRYRHRKGRRARYWPARSWKQMRWVLVPAALVMLCDLWIEWDSSRVWAQVKEEVPQGDVRVRIVGRQFSWEFVYPGPDGRFDTGDDIRSAELHVPRGKVVRFELQSRDVIHNFYVRELRLKQDAVPGRTLPGWFVAEREGRFPVLCAELCGSAHSFMKGTMVVQAPEAFEQWLAQQAARR